MGGDQTKYQLHCTGIESACYLLPLLLLLLAFLLLLFLHLVLLTLPLLLLLYYYHYHFRYFSTTTSTVAATNTTTTVISISISVSIVISSFSSSNSSIIISISTAINLDVHLGCRYSVYSIQLSLVLSRSMRHMTYGDVGVTGNQDNKVISNLRLRTHCIVKQWRNTHFSVLTQIKTKYGGFAQENKQLGFRTTSLRFKEITKTGYPCDGVWFMGLYVYTFQRVKVNSVLSVTTFNYYQSLDMVKQIKGTCFEY